MADREVMQLALDAFKGARVWHSIKLHKAFFTPECDAAIAALEAALAAPPSEAQPVAWYEAEEFCRGMPLRQMLSPYGVMCHSGRFCTEQPKTNNPVWPLYTHPQPAVSREEARKLLYKVESKAYRYGKCANDETEAALEAARVALLNALCPTPQQEDERG